MSLESPFSNTNVKGNQEKAREKYAHLYPKPEDSLEEKDRKSKLLRSLQNIEYEITRNGSPLTQEDADAIAAIMGKRLGKGTGR